MEPRYSQWLTSEEPPSDFYELLGEKRFTPDYGRLEAAVRQATREIFPYQQHSDAKIANRASQLLHQLGDAKSLLDNPARMANYHRDRFAVLKQQYAQEQPDPPSAWSPHLVEQWLTENQQVDELAAPAILFAWGLSAPEAPTAPAEPAGEPVNADRPRPTPPPRRAPVPAPVASPPTPPPTPRRQRKRRSSVLVHVVGGLTMVLVALGVAFFLHFAKQAAPDTNPPVAVVPQVPQPAANPEPASDEELPGSQWSVRLPNGRSAVWDFQPGGRLLQDGIDVGPWRQEGDDVTVVVNDFSTWKGKLEGNQLSGSASNKRGGAWQWTAVRSGSSASALPPPMDIGELVGTRWSGLTAGKPRTYEFLPNGVLRCTSDGQKPAFATWFKQGDQISWEMNDGFARYTGLVSGNRMAGTAVNKNGDQWNWDATKR